LGTGSLVLIQQVNLPLLHPDLLPEQARLSSSLPFGKEKFLCVFSTFGGLLRVFGCVSEDRISMRIFLYVLFVFLFIIYFFI